MKNRVTRCSSVKLPVHPYSPGAIELFYSVVPEVRKVFLRDALDPSNFQGEVFVGRRVKGDTDVLLRLQSHFDEAEFRGQPLTAVYEAVQGCAEADWWYEHEKEFGDKRRIHESEGMDALLEDQTEV